MELEPTIETKLAIGEPAVEQADEATDAPLVEDELLVEEISIDGMCGVY